jgi:hypothetical protein
MATIKIRVNGEIATNLTPEVKLVCQNEKYTVEFEFDESWANSNVKTALFIYNGKVLPIPFDREQNGNVCKIPALYDTELLHIGVKSNDVEGLHTTTPAKIGCLLSANDIANGEITNPTPNQYDEIIALLNKYLQQGGGEGEGAKELVTVDIASMLEEQNVELFLDLSKRYANGEIIVVGILGSDVGVLTGAKYENDGTTVKADWYLTGLYWSGLDTTGTVTSLAMTAFIFQCDGTEILFDTVSVPLGDPMVKEALTIPSETWTPDEQSAACETIGAVSIIDNKSGQNRVYIRTHDNENSSAAIYYAAAYNTQADWAKIDGGLPSYISGELGCATPTGDYRAANKKYVDDKVGAIDTALDNILVIQNSLIGGGTQ